MINSIKLLVKLALTSVIMAGCASTNIESKNEQVQVSKNFIQQGWKVVCVGGGYYLTGSGYLGGCGSADIDYIVLDVPIKIGQGINDEDDDVDTFNKFSASEMKHHAKSAVRFYS